MIQKKVVCLLLAILMLLSLSACSTAQNALPTVPFSDADWLWSLDELQKHLGVPESSYLSVYGGETCTYPFSYMGRDGIIKYMFSESGKLASIAWAYITQDADDPRTTPVTGMSGICLPVIFSFPPFLAMRVVGCNTPIFSMSSLDINLYSR